MASNYDYEVPFSYKGTLIHQVGEGEDPEWRENTPFEATLSIDWLEPGATIKRVMVLRDTTSHTAYPMFVDDIITLMRSAVIDHGIVTGKWRVKRTGRKTVLYTLVKVDD